MKVTKRNQDLDKALDSQFRGLVFKTTGWFQSKVNPAFHPFEVDKMSTRNLWELCDTK